MGILIGRSASECQVLMLASARLILLHQFILSSLVSAEIMCLKQKQGIAIQTSQTNKLYIQVVLYHWTQVKFDTTYFHLF